MGLPSHFFILCFYGLIITKVDVTCFHNETGLFVGKEITVFQWLKAGQLMSDKSWILILVLSFANTV